MLKRIALPLCAASALSSPCAFAQGAPLAPVEQTSLARDAFSTGLLERSAGALGSDLWRGADASTLAMLLKMAPSSPSSPAIGAALRRVLLSPGSAPTGAPASLGGAKLKALARAGFGEEARQIESLAAGDRTDPASAEAIAIADILSNDTSAACDKGRRVTAGLENSFWVRLRVVCYAASNELDAAELALGILRENGRLGEIDETLLAPLAAGGKSAAVPAVVDAVHYAALKAMGTPLSAGMLAGAEGGVVKAAALDAKTDWPTRLAAAKRATMMGVISGAELKSLYSAAPSDASGAYGSIRAMTAPELLRDRAGQIASQIAAAQDFDSVYALSALYADEIRETEGAIIPAQEAASLALARLLVGDAVGAERWLVSAAGEVARGVPEVQATRFAELVGVLGVLEPAAAQRVYAVASLSAAPPRATARANATAPSPDLAPVVAAAIEAARVGGTGEAALAALAASDAAAKGDPIAHALVEPALRAAGLTDIVRRRAVELAIAAMFPRSVISEAPALPTPASAPAKLTPRLKPKQPA